MSIVIFNIRKGATKSVQKQKAIRESNTFVINAFGGPGAGKTTAAWHIAAELKKLGFCVEYVSEYAKELVWEKQYDLLDGSLENQQILLEEQSHRLDRIYGQVDFIVTDSPLLLNIMYLNKYNEKHQKEVLSKFDKYNNFNFFVERGERFEQEGRIHDLDESKQKDIQIKSFLKIHNIYYGTYKHEKIDTLIRNIVDHYEKQRTNDINIDKMKGEDNDMKLVISGKMAGVNISEVSLPSGTHKVVNFTVYAYDPNAPIKGREDGTSYKAGIPLKCVAWDDKAVEIEKMISEKKNILTAAVTMRYNEFTSKDGRNIIEPQYVIRKIDKDNDLHRQMSSLISCYEEGKISQIFEKEIQPRFSNDLEQDMDVSGPDLEMNHEHQKA